MSAASVERLMIDALLRDMSWGAALRVDVLPSRAASPDRGEALPQFSLRKAAHAGLAVLTLASGAVADPIGVRWLRV